MSDLSHCVHVGRPHAGKTQSPLKVLLNWISLSKQRRILGGLDSDRLSDLGLSSKDALEEAQKPFWDAPAYWHHLK